MKRIGLYLSAKPDDGGAFQYNQAMLDAVLALPKDIFELIIAYSDERWKAYINNHSAATIEIKKTFFNRALAGAWEISGLPMSIWRNISRYFHPLTKKFVKTDCDLWIFPSQDPWTHRIPVPALGTILDLMHRYEARFDEVSSLYKQRERKYKNMCLWAKAVLVDSELGRHQVHESYGLSLNSIKVLPFTPPKYIYSTQVPLDFNDRYPLPKKYLFYPAHFWNHKNHQALVKAVAQLKPSLPDIAFVFVGSKKNGYESTVQLVRELNLADSITFLGHVPEQDIPELYRRARAMIMPTFFGPTNIPPLEAFVTGCPVAVSNIYAMPEQVGDAAILFDPNSDKEIINAIVQLWTNDGLCAQLTSRGFKQVKQYDQGSFSRRLHDIIHGILDTP